MSKEQIFEYEEGRECSRELLIQTDNESKNIYVTAQETVEYDREGNSTEFNEISMNLRVSDAKNLVFSLSKWLWDNGLAR